MATLRIDETRRLVVPLDTAVDALLELDHSRSGELATGRLHSARMMGLDPEGQEEPGLEIVVEDSHYGKVKGLRSCVFPLQIVAAALLSYCIKSHIPVPRSAKKSIELTPEGYVLTFQVGLALVHKHGTLPDTPADPPKQPQPPAEAMEHLGVH